jgi:CHC2 zinc finger
MRLLQKTRQARGPLIPVLQRIVEPEVSNTRIYTRPIRTSTQSVGSRNFDRALLPSAETFFRTNVKGFRRYGTKAFGLCPFHNDRNHPSLSLCLIRGLFHCFACDASGDLIDFVRLRDNVGFVVAAETLGAWRGEMTGKERRVWREQRRRAEEERAAAVNQAHAERRLRLEYRTELLTLHRIQRLVGHRLSELLRGLPERLGNEMESCWGLLAMIQDDVREAECSYSLLAFGAKAKRETFLHNPGCRYQIIQETLLRGYLVDDHGRVLEVAA